MMSKGVLSINPEKKTVGEIVAENYHAAGVLRQYGIDFCCGGGSTLQEACGKKNIDIKNVLNDLKNIHGVNESKTENYMAWEPEYLISHIINTHHQYVRIKTDEICQYASKVAQVHGRTYPENIDINDIFRDLSQEMLRHLSDEEERVFPLIRDIYDKRTKGTDVASAKIEELQTELEHMVEDHEGAGAAMLKIRQLSHNFTPPEGACTTYRILYQNLEDFEKDLHKHVHLENNILFRKAQNLLS